MVPTTVQHLVSSLTARYRENDIGQGTHPIIDEDGNSFEVADTKLQTYQNRSIFGLPAGGEAYDDCGRWISALGCDNYDQPTIDGSKHDRFAVKHSCGRPECPVCYGLWAAKLAGIAGDRIIQGLKLYRAAGVKTGRIDHVVFSPPQDRAIEMMRTPDGYRELRDKAVKLMKECGMKGGVLIFHPFRQNDPREPNFNPNIPLYVWYMSPHFHVVGYGYLENSKTFFERTGWIYKKMPRRETINGTIKYTLTHCGITKGIKSLTWFGTFSYNKIVKDSVVMEYKPIKCRGCGAALLEYPFKDNEVDKDGNPVPDWDKPLGVYYHNVKKITYKLRNIPKPVYVDDSDFQKRFGNFG